MPFSAAAASWMVWGYLERTWTNTVCRNLIALWLSLNVKQATTTTNHLIECHNDFRFIYQIVLILSIDLFDNKLACNLLYLWFFCTGHRPNKISSTATGEKRGKVEIWTRQLWMVSHTCHMCEFGKKSESNNDFCCNIEKSLFMVSLMKIAFYYLRNLIIAKRQNLRILMRK